MNIEQIRERGQKALALTSGMDSYDAVYMLIQAAYCVADVVKRDGVNPEDVGGVMHSVIDELVRLDKLPDPGK